MKQILQHWKSGELEVAEFPAPLTGPGKILIRTQMSRTIVLSRESGHWVRA